MFNKEKDKFRKDDEKLKELILFISERSEGDKYFGATKLNKLLFYSDFLAYLHLGKPITGHKYEAMPDGPMIKGFYEFRSEMEENDEIATKPMDFWGYTQHRSFALRNTDVSKFSSEELDIVTRIISQFAALNAKQISAESHGFLGWQAVDFGDEIPYETALVGIRELTIEEFEFPEGITFNLEKCKVPIDDLGV